MGHATLVNAGGIDFGASTVGGNLTATSTTGNLTDGQTVTVGGTAGFTSSAGGADIVLDELAVTGDIALTTHGPMGHATLVNAGGIDFGASTVGGNLTATATTGNLTDEWTSDGRWHGRLHEQCGRRGYCSGRTGGDG